MMTRRVFIPSLLAVATALLLGACKATDTAGNVSAGSKSSANPSVSAPTGTTEVHADGVRRVTPSELQAMLAGGRAVVYDTRPKTAYDAEHIQGALSISLAGTSSLVSGTTW